MKRWPVFSVLCSLLLPASGVETNQEPAPEPAAGKASEAAPPPPIPTPSSGINLEKTLYDVPMVEDDTGILTTFKFGPAFWDIREQKSALAGQKEAASPHNSTRFKEAALKLDPLIFVEKADLDQAFEKRRKVGGDSPAIWEMDVPISLFPESYSQTAASCVNTKFAGAAVDANNFSPVRYRYIEFTVDNGSGGRINVGAYPDASLNRFAPLAGVSLSIPKLRIRGTEEFLKSISTLESRIWAEVFVGGFAVRQNIVSGTINQIVNSGYYRFLTGEADFSQMTSVTNSQGGFGSALGLFSFANKNSNSSETVSGKSWVTRNQLRTVIERSFSAVSLANWTEIQGDTTIQEAIINKVMDFLVKKDNSTEANLQYVEKRWEIEDQSIRKDISPQQLMKLNAQINGKLQVSNKAEVVGKGSLKNSFIADDDIIMASDGGIEIPKRVNLVMVDSALLENCAKIGFTHTVANSKVAGSRLQMLHIHALQEHAVEVDGPSITKYLEVYWDHYKDRLYMVVNPNVADPGLNGFGGGHGNELYRNWCKDTGVTAKRDETPKIQYNGHEANYVRVLAAHESVLPNGEEIKKLGLPPIHPRWPKVLDNERWYLYEFQAPTKTTVKKSVDVWK